MENTNTSFADELAGLESVNYLDTDDLENETEADPMDAETVYEKLPDNMQQYFHADARGNWAFTPPCDTDGLSDAEFKAKLKADQKAEQAARAAREAEHEKEMEEKEKKIMVQRANWNEEFKADHGNRMHAACEWACMHGWALPKAGDEGWPKEYGTITPLSACGLAVAVLHKYMDNNSLKAISTELENKRMAFDIPCPGDPDVRLYGRPDIIAEGTTPAGKYFVIIDLKTETWADLVPVNNNGIIEGADWLTDESRKKDYQLYLDNAYQIAKYCAAYNDLYKHSAKHTDAKFSGLVITINKADGCRVLPGADPRIYTSVISWQELVTRAKAETEERAKRRAEKAQQKAGE